MRLTGRCKGVGTIRRLLQSLPNNFVGAPRHERRSNRRAPLRVIYLWELKRLLPVVNVYFGFALTRIADCAG